MNTSTKLPDWFNGTLYQEGGVVHNRFTGEEYELNNVELSMYDYVMGATIIMELGLSDDRAIKTLRKGLDWFREYNPKAYMVLLD